MANTDNKMKTEYDYIFQNSEGKIAVLSDFDGVISKANVMNALYDKFGVSNWRFYTKQWEEGKISTQEEINNCLGTARVKKKEMEEFIKDIPLDPSISYLYEFCQNEGFYFAIISEGFRWYINVLLDLHGIYEVPIFANEIRFHVDRLSFSYPWYNKETPLRGTSKSTIIKNFHENGYQTIFLGDGHNDIKAACIADFVYAKGYLLEYANDVGMSAKSFMNLMEVTDNIKTMIYQEEKDIG